MPPGLLDDLRKPQLRQPRMVLRGQGVDAALAASPTQSRGDARLGDLCGNGGCRRQRQDHARFGARQVGGAALGERGEEAGVVLAQHGAEFLRGAGSPPDGVLGCAGQHCDSLDQFAVGGQRPMRVSVSARNVR